MTSKLPYFLIIFGAILLILGFFLGLKSIKPIALTLMSGIVILIGTGFGLFGKFLQDSSSSEKSEKIRTTGEATNEIVNTLRAQNGQLLKKSRNQANKIDSLREENTDLHLKLAKASETIFGQVTGGDSYCKLDVSFLRTGEPFFMFEHVGKYPLKAVPITIEDFGRRITLMKGITNPASLLEIVKNTTYSHTESFYPGAAQIDFKIPIESNQADIDLRITFFLPNGHVSEHLEVKNFSSKDRTLKLEIRRDNEILEERNR